MDAVTQAAITNKFLNPAIQRVQSVGQSLAAAKQGVLDASANMAGARAMAEARNVSEADILALQQGLAYETAESWLLVLDALQVALPVFAAFAGQEVQEKAAEIADLFPAAPEDPNPPA